MAYRLAIFHFGFVMGRVVAAAGKHRNGKCYSGEHHHQELPSGSVSSLPRITHCPPTEQTKNSTTKRAFGRLQMLSSLDLSTVAGICPRRSAASVP
jgi:hypothetical protein